MAGYSHRSLVEKLGIKSGSRVIFIESPKDYPSTLGKLPEEVKLEATLSGMFDFIQYFCSSKEELMSVFPAFKKHLQPAGMLWVSWPKGSSKISSDLNENIIREVGLKNGLVDIKVCAVDDDWSGLKFVYRVTDR